MPNRWLYTLTDLRSKCTGVTNLPLRMLTKSEHSYRQECVNLRLRNALVSIHQRSAILSAESPGAYTIKEKEEAYV
jgi:hypothetical protein